MKNPGGLYFSNAISVIFSLWPAVLSEGSVICSSESGCWRCEAYQQRAFRRINPQPSHQSVIPNFLQEIPINNWNVFVAWKTGVRTLAIFERRHNVHVVPINTFKLVVDVKQSLLCLYFHPTKNISMWTSTEVLTRPELPLAQIHNLQTKSCECRRTWNQYIQWKIPPWEYHLQLPLP